MGRSSLGQPGVRYLICQRLRCHLGKFFSNLDTSQCCDEPALEEGESEGILGCASLGVSCEIA
jgi:hypothetical protein